MKHRLVEHLNDKGEPYAWNIESQFMWFFWTVALRFETKSSAEEYFSRINGQKTILQLI